MPRKADHLLLPTDPQPTGAFGRAVVARRRHLGLSQEHLAARAGLSRKYMSDVELGKRNLTYIGIHRIAAGLEMRPGALVHEADKLFAEESPWLVEAVRRGSVDE
jgi:transcriptional regulator with XRE-family HTH domain